jgi:hypothetical protein
MSLDTRVLKLEGRFIAHVAPGCASCGLRHVYPVTVAMVRALFGVTAEPVVPLCLCACCAESRDLAEQSHRRPGDPRIAPSP